MKSVLIQLTLNLYLLACFTCLFAVYWCWAVFDV